MRTWLSPVGKRYTIGARPDGWYSSNPFLAAYQLTDTLRSLHTGDDLQLVGNCERGRPVYAMTDGEVLLAERVQVGGVYTTWGNLVVLDYGDGLSRYAHLAEKYVRQGQTVLRGQMVGRIGGTGKTLQYWNDHLHYDCALSAAGLAKLRRAPTYWPYLDRVELLNVFINPASLAYDELKFEGEAYDVTAFLNARSEPTLTARRVTMLYPHEAVHVSDWHAEWRFVAEVQAWVHRRWLKRVEAQNPERGVR